MTMTLQAPPRPKVARQPRPATPRPAPAPARQTPAPARRREPAVLGILLRLIASLLTLGMGLRLLAENEPPVYGVPAPALGYVLIGVGLVGVYLGRAFFLSDPLDKRKGL